jgi:F-type H+-transporting ATPase subunit b
MLGESIFLIPNGTFFVELAVFLVILVLIYKKALPPIVKNLEARQEKIRTSLAAADEAAHQAAEAETERQRVLNEARDSAREIVAAATAAAEQVRSEAAGRGQAEYDRIVGAAHAEVEAAKQRAIDEAAAKVGDVAFDLVTKIVGREVDQAAHQDLVREAVAALGSVKA